MNPLLIHLWVTVAIMFIFNVGMFSTATKPKLRLLNKIFTFAWVLSIIMWIVFFILLFTK